MIEFTPRTEEEEAQLTADMMAFFETVQDSDIDVNEWLGDEYSEDDDGENGEELGDIGEMVGITKGQPLKDPKGGLTAAGRAKYNRETGSNLKPGVTGAADTPEKMRRKGSFLTRFFTNPSGPMVNEKGEPTRLALSANAWGEPVPKNRSDAAKLAAKGRNLLARYENVKKGEGAGHPFRGNQHTRVAIAAQTKEIMGLLTKKAGEQVANGLKPLVEAAIEEFHAGGASNEPLLVNGKKVSMGGQVVTTASFLDLLVSEVGMKAVFGRDISAEDFKQGEKFLKKGGGLTQWFDEKWVDLSRPKEGGGYEPCGRPDAHSGHYPKCVPAARAENMTPEQIKSAISRKRRAESQTVRQDKKPIMVETIKKENTPVDIELYNKVKAEAKAKFDVYPSAYANGWLVQEYKRRGGKYKTSK